MNDEALHPLLEVLCGTIIAERYGVDAVIGAGSMGAVFRGRHLALGRPVAIKVLHPRLTQSEDIVARFEREARGSSRLDHPNCIQVMDAGRTETNLPYMVMTLLDGYDLRSWTGKAFAVDQAVGIMRQVVSGLDHAHRQGIVHRDLKPENIHVGRDETGSVLLKLIDFGVARIVKGATRRDNITARPTVVGTPDYMSPEQALGAAPDARTDLYAAGVLFYELLAGHRPFSAETAELLMQKHLMAPVPPLPASVPEPVARVVYRLLEKERDNRYSSAGELLNVLERLRAEL